ncbi:MAG: contractile injection system protein, VgrG/Pvc8 family [Alphaproteobacteria bacterium]|nr:contractile injection system protein, VgrG/Pvc8 family [Alphaproteobacteria bacterium]
MTPNFKILADKTDITDLLNGRLLSLAITDEIGLASDSLTLELDDRDSVLEIPPRGAEMEAFLGYGERYSMGKFIVDEAEIKSPPATLTITARASNSGFRDMGAFKSPRSYSWQEYTLLGIVQTIAKRYGLAESVADEYRKILVKHLDQTDESDCAFIQRLAADYGASVKIAGGRLLFIEPLSGKFPDGTPMPAIPIKTEEICGYQMRLAERGKYEKVVAKYYDFDLAEEQKVSAGSGSPAFTLRDTFTSRSQAMARAKQKLAEIASGTRTLSLDLIGNPLLSAESVVELPNLRPEIAGRWVVKSARHTLSASGYKTTIEATRKE